MAGTTLARRILLAKPRTYSDSLVLNLLGWQIVRIFGLWLWRVLRIPKSIPVEYRDELTTLDERGALIVPNFLPTAEFEQIKKEFDSLKPQFVQDSSEVGLPHVMRMSIYDARVSDALRTRLMNHPHIGALAQAYLNRTYHFPWNVFLTSINCSDEEAKLPQNGGTNNLHMDVPTRVFKAFYYLTPADKDSGTLHYCFGSHRHSGIRRLIFEYILSVRYAMNRWNPETGGEYRVGEPWVKVTDEEIKRYGLVETPLTVPANALVIGDVGGFHRRGNFARAGERNTIEFNFREVETLRNTLFPLEKLIRKAFKLPPPAFEQQHAY